MTNQEKAYREIVKALKELQKEDSEAFDAVTAEHGTTLAALLIDKRAAVYQPAGYLLDDVEEVLGEVRG